MNYSDFIASKERVNVATGIEGEIVCSPHAKRHQSRGITWACRKGRALIGYNTGLGKTLMQLDISRIVIEHKGGKALILAPLAVTQQTVKEGERWGIPTKFVKTQAECDGPGIYITNYQKIEHFDLSLFTCLTIDEASILKDFTSKTTTILLDIAQVVPYRFCFSATPSPNDFTELGNYAEFLGICTREEMLTTYFVHDGETTQEWRLKGHAKDKFWKWLCTFMIAANLPSDVCGCESDCHCDDGYILPEARIHEHIIECAEAHEGQLFPELANTLTEQRKVKRDTLSIRAKEAADIVASHDSHSIVWCNLNDEADQCAELIPGAVQISGADDDDAKEAKMMWFLGLQCICELMPKQFRAKLAECGNQNTKQIDAVSAPPIQNTESVVIEPLELQRKTPSTCVNITQTTKESSSSILSSGLSETNAVESDTQPIPNIGAKQTRKSRKTASQKQSSLVFSENTESLQSNSATCSPVNLADVQSVEQKTGEPKNDCQSITVTKQTESEDCCAEVATLQSDTCKTIAVDFKKQSCTCGVLSNKRVLVSKPTICGFGINFQHCAHQVYFPTHSAEQFYQSVRRSQRFGQTKQVNIHIVLSDGEIKILKNITRKIVEIEEIVTQLVKFMGEHHDLKATRRVQDDYNPTERMELPEFI